MADVGLPRWIVLQANETSNNSSGNGTQKTPATPEGMALAYGSLVLMALLPIFYGSVRSLKFHKDKDKKTETMSTKDAAMFPIIASCALLGLYVVFQLFSKEYINLLLTGYFFFLGVLALTHLLSPILSNLVPSSVPNVPYHILFRQGGDGNKGKDLINYRFTTYDVVALVLCSLFGGWYLLKKHWIANNLFGLAFAVNGVELLHLSNVVTGCILLAGLFVYDIFWVFGTDVMVTVAKSFEAPIKVVFPQDLLVNGLSANNFAMLGLGDIVIPGIFIALLLRFDHSLKRKTRTYFYATFAAYFVGLLTTIFVMHVFKHAQPALLYLVPACVGTPIALAVVKGDLKRLFKYEDDPEEKKAKKDNSQQLHQHQHQHQHQQKVAEKKAK